MKMKIFRICLSIVLLLASMIPIIDAAFITIYPVDTEDDAYITGAGNYFGDTPFLPLRSSVTNFVIGTRFKNVAIPQGSKINNATLRVKATYTYPIAGDIRVTITGDDADDSLAFNDSSSFSRTYTLAYEVWNISEVNGDIWAEVDVTSIVQEIVDRVGWVSGNSLSLVYFTDKGSPRREFSSIDDNVIYRARIEIFYNVDPPSQPFQDQAGTPYNETDLWTWLLNRTYRGIDIWDVTNDGVNRSGYPSSPSSVNWGVLNLTELTELDSGAALTVNNASWVSINSLVAQQINTLYNDTGAAVEIVNYFVRGAVNLSAVTNSEAISDQVFTVTGISSATPVGGGGLREGNIGDWAGLEVMLNADDQRWLLRMAERSGVADDVGASSSGWMFESTNERIWFEFQLKDVGAQNWIRTRLYRNPNYSGLFWTETHVLTQAGIGPAEFRYPQVCSSVAFGTSEINKGEMYTLIDPVEFDSFTFLAYPNGTLVDPDPLPPDLDPDDIDDIIDDLLGGAQPEDPQEDEYPVISRFRWKLLVLAVGLIMMLGSPIAGILYGADTATWIKLLFVAFFGLGILWQIKFM